MVSLIKQLSRLNCSVGEVFLKTYIQSIKGDTNCVMVQNPCEILQIIVFITNIDLILSKIAPHNSFS